jgi:hypothetical protein
VKYILTIKPPTENGIVLQKRLQLQALDYMPFSILAVLCNGEDLIKVVASAFQALLKGAGKIAEWSSWPRNPELITWSTQEPRPTPGAITDTSQLCIPSCRGSGLGSGLPELARDHGRLGERDWARETGRERLGKPTQLRPCESSSETAHP